MTRQRACLTIAASVSTIRDVKRLALLALALLALAVASYFVVYRDRVYLGVHAAGYDLGGLTRSQATDLLRLRAAPTYASRIVTLTSGGRLWAPTYTDLGARLDPDATVAAAYAVGRGSPLGPLRALLLPLRPVALPPAVTVDPGPFNDFIGRLALETAVAPKNASVAVAGSTTYAVPAQPGRRLDIPALAPQLQAILRAGATTTIDLPMTDALPQVSDSNDAAQQALRLAGAPLSLTFGDRAWTLKPTDLQDMLTYQVDEAGRLTTGLDRTRLQAWVARLSPDIDRPARDGRLRWDVAASRPVATQASQEGLALDVFASTSRLMDALQASLTSAAPPLAERRAEATIRRVAPAVDTSQPDKLGIKELVWEETSFFQGSEAGRVRNIQLAASKFDGVTIPPGATFSFNQTVGEISAKTGYDETLIIVDNQTQRGPGGGVCQVSTTVFRAAFWAGLPFVERYAHAYRVSYYEQGNKPLGLEAAIFHPDVDLKFTNDTGATLLMQTAVNPANGSLTVRLYGTKPAREVALEGPTVKDRKPPGPPVYQDDPALPVGQTKQVEVAREGMDVELFRVIKRGGQVLSREKFVSEYIPTQATFKVGKKV